MRLFLSALPSLFFNYSVTHILIDRWWRVSFYPDSSQIAYVVLNAGRTLLLSGYTRQQRPSNETKRNSIDTTFLLFLGFLRCWTMQWVAKTSDSDQWSQFGIEISFVKLKAGSKVLINGHTSRPELYSREGVVGNPESVGRPRSCHGFAFRLHFFSSFSFFLPSFLSLSLSLSLCLSLFF